ncbi:MAG: tetraacyldisaccharide 4'-kinase [Myxococcales bacterium]|nr:tetraacyldisaccharide 4'-kinase [Myxococcales bacterium]
MVDAAAGRGVAPGGPLRLPLDLLDRADRVWLHKVDQPGARPLAGAHVQSVVRPRALETPAGDRVPLDWLAGRRVRALSAIGRPASFEATLTSLGAELAPGLRRADHHRFTRRELSALPTDLPWITTAKDAERLGGFPAWVLHVDVGVVEGRGVVDELAGRAP